MDYKLIAVDMDGTLLKDDKSVHKDTINDINMAVSRGVNIAFCTGRGMIQLSEYFNIFKNIRYAVCCSGGVLYDIFKDKIIYRDEIEKPYTEKIIEITNKYDGMVNFLTDNECIMKKDDLNRLNKFGMEVYRPLLTNYTRKVSDMIEESKKNKNISKMNICFKSDEDKMMAYDELKRYPLELAFGKTTGIEVNKIGVTKASGLKILGEKLNISLDEIVGIGDADNDREMLKTVGFPIAMENATDDIKKIASYITLDNEHNGVGEAIRYLFKE